MGLCIYCGKEGSLTDEHALPKSVGGNLPKPNVLRVGVHECCNNLCGRYVDAPLARSYLILVERANPDHYPPGVWPDALHPIGYRHGVTPTGAQVDVWLYCGHWVVHIHPTYDDPRDPTVELYGPPIPPVAGKAGQCFLFFTSNEAGKAQAFVDACKLFFEGAILYCVQPFSTTNPFPPVRAEHAASAEFARTLIAERNVNGRLHFAQAGTDRFAAKLALAVGSNVLGSRYLEHKCCPDLRDVLWERSPDARDSMRLKAQGVGARLMSGSRGLAERVALPRCHTFLISNVGNALSMFGFLYGKYELLAILCDCKTDLWREAVGRDGLVVVVSLATGKVSDPVPLVEFIAWRGPHRQPSAKLDALGINPSS